MVESAGTDWMQDHVDAGVNRAERLEREAESWRDVFESDALDNPEFEFELLEKLPCGTMLRLCLNAIGSDRLEPHYSKNKGKADGDAFDKQFQSTLDEWVEHLKDKWKRQNERSSQKSF